MSQHTSVLLTTGAAGSGKSYARCAYYLVMRFLPEQTGVHISNFPIHLDKMVEVVKARHGADLAALVPSRVRMIPKEELDKWMVDDGGFGPWSYFSDADLNGSHIAIDEIHNFCGRHHSKAHRAKWQVWLGEIRHRGATIEFLTQSPMKVAKEIKYESGVLLELYSWETVRDPIFAIPVGDWLQFYAKLTGKWQPRISVIERRQVGNFWRKESVDTFHLDPELFTVYDSFSAPVAGGKAGQAKEREFQRRSWLGLTGWFLRQHFFNLGWRVALAVGVPLFIFGGGIGCVVTGMNEAVLATLPASSQPSKGSSNAGSEFRTGGGGDVVRSLSGGSGDLGQSRGRSGTARLEALTDGALCINGEWYRVGEFVDVAGFSGVVRKVDSLTGRVDISGRVHVVGFAGRGQNVLPKGGATSRPSRRSAGGSRVVRSGRGEAD